jgi:hypothetical protein
MPTGVARARSPGWPMPVHVGLAWWCTGDQGSAPASSGQFVGQGAGGETHQGGAAPVRWRRRASVAAFRLASGVAVVGSEHNDALKHRGGGG